MGQVYGAGGKTMPKRGRLGTGSYWPAGTPIYVAPGTIFPGFTPEPPDFHQTTFGDPSRAGIATVVGQNRVNQQGVHPNKSQYNVITLPLLTPATQVASPADNTNLQPLTSPTNPLQMPHERNTNSASGTHKKPLPFRTAFGASSSMPTDTAFKAKPGAMYVHQARAKQRPAVEAVKKVASTRTFAHVDNPLPVGGGVNPKQQHRTPPASFVSRNNIWYDPNNSFQGGVSGGKGRWATVKTGVIPATGSNS